MLLTLEVTPEPIGTQHLQDAEEDEKRQTLDEMMPRRHFGILLQGIVVLVDQLST